MKSLLCLLISLALPLLALTQVRREIQGVRMDFRVTEATPVFDKKTGARIPFAEYRRMTSPDPRKFHAEPRYDEYGEATSFWLRETTDEERETGRFNAFGFENQPKIGQPLPIFTVEAVNGQRYRSADLKGKVVLLSFWFSFKSPVFSDKQRKRLTDVLDPFRQKAEVISLGFGTGVAEALDEALLAPSSPLIPISGANGFIRRYGVITLPSFIVVDSAGNVAGFVETFSDSSGAELQAILQKLIP